MKNSYEVKDNVCPFLTISTQYDGELTFFRLHNIYGERISNVIWDKSQDEIEKMIPNTDYGWTPF